MIQVYKVRINATNITIRGLLLQSKMAILKRVCCFGKETVFLVFPMLTFIDCILFGIFIHFLVSKVTCSSSELSTGLKSDR